MFTFYLEIFRRHENKIRITLVKLDQLELIRLTFAVTRQPLIIVFSLIPWEKKKT